MLELVEFVFAAGIRVINACEIAKQCEVEVVRIAVRTQNVLGTLKSASEHFENNVELRASLIELKDVFESIHSLVGRCGMPIKIRDRASLLLQRNNHNQVALIQAEKQLERVTKDLGLPMLTDIKQQLNRMQEEARQAASEAASAATAVNADVIAEVIRTEIRRAMAVKGAGEGNASIQDMISKEIAHLQGDDDDCIAAKGKANAKTLVTAPYSASPNAGVGDSTSTKGPNDQSDGGGAAAAAKTPSDENNSGGDGDKRQTGEAGGTAKNKGGAAKTLPYSSSSTAVGGLVVRLGRVHFDDLEEGGVLGEGTFGTVLAGTYRGRDVAIKKARGALGSTSILEAFRQEAEIHYSMRHPNIVEVIAFALGDKQRPPCMVMERMHETMYDVLAVEGIAITTLAAVSIIRDVCEGLNFLHMHRIVHRDLKSLNVLLDEAWSAKISDFGLAKVNSTVAASTGGDGYHSKVGSNFWMAPEVHSNHKATRASDVFSLHVVIWEALTKQRAGTGTPIGERLLRNPDARLPLGEIDCPDLVASHIKSLFEGTGAADKSKRPTMEEICPLVNKLFKAFQDPDEKLENLLPPVRPKTRQRAPPSYDNVMSRSSGVATAPVLLTGESQKGGAPPTLPPRPGTVSVGSVPPPLPKRAAQLGKQSRSDDRGVLYLLHQNWLPVAAPGAPAWTWKLDAGWGTTIDLTRWYGVRSCYIDAGMGGMERVVELILPGNKLCGPLPKEIGHLDLLTTLNLSNNLLTGEMPASLGFLLSLDSLDLSANNIAGSILPELSNILPLRNLKLDHTGLYGEIPDSMGNLKLLETLDLGDCELWGPIPAALSRLRNLRVLHLGANKLSGGIPEELAGLTRLVDLDLHGNKLTGHILGKPGMLPALQILDLSDNLLHGLIPPEVCQLRRLRILRLYRNTGLCGGIPAALGESFYLEEVDLSTTRLGGEIPIELGGLSLLSRLALGSCKLVGAIPAQLGRLVSLKHLGLFDNDLTGSIPVEILQLRNIRMLNLERNKLKVTKALIGGTKHEIKKILPKGCVVRL